MTHEYKPACIKCQLTERHMVSLNTPHHTEALPRVGDLPKITQLVMAELGCELSFDWLQNYALPMPTEALSPTYFRTSLQI